jgi:hypothetical protein
MLNQLAFRHMVQLHFFKLMPFAILSNSLKLAILKWPNLSCQSMTPVENNRIKGEIAHSKTQRSHKYVNNAWRECSNSPPTLLFIPFPVPPH